MDALVHHFSHAQAEAYLRQHVSMDDVWWHLTFLDAPRDEAPLISRGRDMRDRMEIMRLMREREITILR
jgi:hypothetical protein